MSPKVEALLNKARTLDAEQRPVAATDAYEKVIATGEAALEVYLDLAVLYWVATDFGYASYHQLDNEFVERAGQRAFQVLEQAAQRFDNAPEIQFWRYYFKFISLGESPRFEYCLRLTRAGNTIVPFFHLHALSGGSFSSEVNELAEWASAETTERQRYIKSVLGSGAI